MDVARTKKSCFRRHGIDAFRRQEEDCLRRLLERSLDEAGIAPDDPELRAVVLPRPRDDVLALTYLPLLAGTTKADPVDFGGLTGHLGAGDMLANVADLTTCGPLSPGEHALILSSGAGFTWSCAVVTAETH